MNDTADRPEIERGASIQGRDGRRIGVVDAVFVDYLLVRTASLPPVDLYIPTADVRVEAPGRGSVETGRSEAYERWHRPLKSVAHD